MSLKKLTGVLLLSVTGVIYSDLSTAGTVGFSLRCVNSIDHTLVYSVTNEKQENGEFSWQSVEHEVQPADRKFIEIGTTETTVVIKDKSDNRILLKEEITCASEDCTFSSLLSDKDYDLKRTASTYSKPPIASLEVVKKVAHS